MERKCSLDQEMIQLSSEIVPPNSTESSEGTITRRRIEVLKSLECPCCFKLIFPPVRDCSNGHHVCSICLDRITDCPLCREPAGITQNRFAEEFIERYVVRCGNYDRGCEKYFWAEELATIQHHENNCRYRMLQCWIPNCQTQAMFGGLMNHWEQIHDVKCSENDEASFKFTMHYGPSAYIVTSMHLTCNGHAFLAIVQAYPRQASTCVYGYYQPALVDEQMITYESHVKLTVQKKNTLTGEISEKIVPWVGKVCKETDSPLQIAEDKTDFFERLPDVQHENEELICTITVKIVPKPGPPA